MLSWRNASDGYHAIQPLTQPNAVGGAAPGGGVGALSLLRLERYRDIRLSSLAANVLKGKVNFHV